MPRWPSPGCERGFLLLRKGDNLEVSVSRDLAGQALDASDLRVPTSVIQRALNSRRELLSMSFNPGASEPFEGADRSVAALELRSAVCVPLVLVQSGSLEETRIASHAQQTVGLLYLDSRLSPADLSAGNREVLTTLAIEASTILENARLMEDQHVKLRMESELKIARDIQQGLAPGVAAQRGMVSRGWIELGVQRSRRRLFRRPAGIRGRVGGGGRRCVGEGRQFRAAGKPAARRVPDGLGRLLPISSRPWRI